MPSHPSDDGRLIWSGLGQQQEESRLTFKQRGLHRRWISETTSGRAVPHAGSLPMDSARVASQWIEPMWLKMRKSTHKDETKFLENVTLMLDTGDWLIWTSWLWEVGMLHINSLNNHGISLFSIANYHSPLYLNWYSFDYLAKPLECTNFACHHMQPTPKVGMSSESHSNL